MPFAIERVEKMVSSPAMPVAQGELYLDSREQPVACAPTGQPPAASAMVGQVLRDTYRVLHVLDQGGMGMVLDAEHLRLHRRVAVKVLLAADSDALARFQQEAEIVSQLSHPHIVQIIDYDTTCYQQPFIVMELLHGESLATAVIVRAASDRRPWPRWFCPGRKKCASSAMATSVG